MLVQCGLLSGQGFGIFSNDGLLFGLLFVERHVYFKSFALFIFGLFSWVPLLDRTIVPNDSAINFRFVIARHFDASLIFIDSQYLAAKHC